MSLPLIDEEKPWYKQGLRFKCTECGQCCSGAPGYAWVSLEEIQEIANFLKISLDEFTTRYIRKIGDRLSLRENKSLNGQYDCVFLKNKRCQIYPVRPKQCQTFPWWSQNLESEETWKETARRCEGIQESAPTVPFEIIETNRLS